MAVSETDLELLEGYLDDALAPRESEALRQRLSSSPELSAALDQLRSERATRQSIFTALEPDDASVSSLITRIQTVTRQHRAPAAWLRWPRYVAAAAACIAAGFFARGLFDRPHSANETTKLVNESARNGVDVRKVEAYRVTLRDDAGRVLAVQQFDSLDKARQFADDLARWQARSERLASGQFIVTTDRF
jgi:anti-sigma factor RsiW